MKSIILFAALASILVCRAASDDSEEFKRPCGSGGDIDKDCVRQYFAEQGSCSVVTQSDDEPVFIERGIYHVPLINLTAIDADTTLDNLDGPIREFYINKDSGNLIYSMKMKSVKYYSPALTFYLHRMDEEPLVVTDEAREEFPHKVLTAVIPLEDGKVSRRSIEKATVSTFFLPEGSYVLELGPNIAESDEPLVQRALEILTEQEEIALKEIFTTQGPIQFKAYLQKHICDFDINLSI